MLDILARLFPKFKKCTCCGKSWKTRDQFVEDDSLDLIGYEANLDALDVGLFLFDHSCGTTLALRADQFKDLYNGPLYTERKTGSAECLGYCLHKSELRSCPAKCECAWVREVMQILRKNNTGG